MLALTHGVLGIVVAAGAIASEKDENVLARLARGLVRLGELVAEKIALVTVVGVAVGTPTAAPAMVLAIAGSTSFASWVRVPGCSSGSRSPRPRSGVRCAARRPARDTRNRRARRPARGDAADPARDPPGGLDRPGRVDLGGVPVAHAVELFSRRSTTSTRGPASRARRSGSSALTLGFGFVARLGMPAALLA